MKNTVLLTVAEVAARLGCSTSSVYLLRKRRQLTFRKGYPLLISERRVKTYIARKAWHHAPMTAETYRIIGERVREDYAKMLVRRQQALDRAACRQSNTPPTVEA